MKTLQKNINLSSLMVALFCVFFVVYLSGCSSNAAKGAAEGGTSGAMAGAVGGLVSALVFGGDPVDSAARGAVYGGATGATFGAMAGSQSKENSKKPTEDKYAQLRKKIGEDTYNGLEALADCRHTVSIKQASKAQKSENPNFALAGLWLEVLNYADQQNESKARTLYPKVIKQDWNIKSNTQAEEAMRKALNRLMDIRQEYNMPRVCTS